MSSSFMQPPVPTPVNPEDNSENPDLDPDQSPEQADRPETPDPETPGDLPPIGDASHLAHDSSAEDSPRGGEAVDTTDEDAVGAEVGMTEGEGSTFEPEEDPEGHR